MSPILEVFCAFGIVFGIAGVFVLFVLFLCSFDFKHKRATREIKSRYGIIWNPRKLAFLYYKRIKTEFMYEDKYGIFREIYSIICSYPKQFIFSPQERESREPLSERRFRRFLREYEEFEERRERELWEESIRCDRAVREFSNTSRLRRLL